MHNHFQIFTFVISGSLMLILFTAAFTSFVFLFRRRATQHREALYRSNIHWEQVLLQTRNEVQEQALQFVSMEMHDNIGQVLCMVHMMLKDALRKQPSGGIPEALIAQSAELLNQSIEDIRKLSYIFSGKMVEDTSITNALETELSYIQSLYKIPCRFVHSIDKSISLPASNRTLLLFRIAQEALQNAVKHSQATGIQCTLNMDSRRLQLSIEDNGRGMNVCRTAKGMGLKNMRERATLLNGTFDIISAPGQGCRVVVCIENTGA